MPNETVAAPTEVDYLQARVNQALYYQRLATEQLVVAQAQLTEEPEEEDVPMSAPLPRPPRRQLDGANLVGQCPGPHCHYRQYRDHDLLLGLLTDPRVMVCVIDGISLLGDYRENEGQLPLTDIKPFVDGHNWPYPDAAQYLGDNLDSLRESHLKTIRRDVTNTGHALWSYGLRLPDDEEQGLL